MEGDFKTVHLLLDDTSFEKLIQLHDIVFTFADRQASVKSKKININEDPGK